MRTGIFRWRAIGPLVGLAVLVAVLWLLFAETLARRSLESIGTRVVGAKVEIGRLDLKPVGATLRQVVVASPHEPFKNLLEAEELTADLAALPLLEKKVVIERLAATGMRFGTRRETDGRVSREEGGGRGLADPRAWSELFDFPALDLVTGEMSIDELDPRNLETVQQAEALVAGADSSWAAWRTRVEQLEDTVTATVDSVNTLVERLRRARITDLGLINDARQTVELVERTQERITGVEREVNATIDSLEAGVDALGAAKRRDYERARELVRLPSFDASAIGVALFGPVAAERFQRAVYWSDLARRYMPSGLDPRARPGPERVRRSGVTVQFPRRGEYPGFLLKTGELSFELGGDAESGRGAREYAGRLTGLTTAPALYGRPTELDVRAPGVVAGGLFDHTGETPRDSLGARISGLRVGELGLGDLPIRMVPGELISDLSFTLEGEQLRARLSLRAASVDWERDTTGVSQLEELVWRVVSGISNLDLSAQLSGPLSSPELSVRSNLDRVMAERLRSVAGEEIARAERQLRAEVDRLVADDITAAQARVMSLEAQVEPLLGTQSERLREARRQLEERLRELTGGLRLPG